MGADRDSGSLRVLHLATTYPLHARDSNAAFVESIAEGLVRLGHRIDVVLPWHPELEPERPGSGVRLHPFSYSPSRRWHPWGYAQALRADRELRRAAYLAAIPAALSAGRAIRRLLRRHRHHLVHAHWLLPNAPIMALARGRRDTPMLVSCHGSGVYLAERRAWAAAMARWALRRTAVATACSADLATRLAALGAGPEPVRVPYGVDLERFHPLDEAERRGARARIARERALDPGSPWVLAVGRLVYKKGFDLAVAALPAILERFPDARLLIAGSGPLEEELRRQAAERGVGDALRLMGPVAHADLPDWYAVADVVTVPSVHGPGGNVDGLPNTLLEALGSGAAVVASRVAGIPDVVEDGHNGLLVPEGDAAALAEATTGLLASPDRRRSLGAAARAGAEANLGWDGVARRFEELYRRALAAGLPSSSSGETTATAGRAPR